MRCWRLRTVPFPEAATKLGLRSGLVVVRVGVDADGTAQLTQIVTSSSAFVDDAGIAFARSAVYTPATVEYRPVRFSSVELRVHFTAEAAR